jgi:hypothetical protein
MEICSSLERVIAGRTGFSYFESGSGIVLKRFFEKKTLPSEAVQPFINYICIHRPDILRISI